MPSLRLLRSAARAHRSSDGRTHGWMMRGDRPEAAGLSRLRHRPEQGDDVGQDGMPQSPVLISVKDQHNRSSSGGFCVGSKNEPKPRREAVYGHGQYATSRCSRSRLPWRRKSAEMCRVRVWVLSLDPCDVCLCRNRATAALLGETICSMLLPQ